MNTSISWMNEVGFGEGGVCGEGVLDNRDDAIVDDAKVGVADMRAVMDESAAEDGVKDEEAEVDFGLGLLRGAGPRCFKPRNDFEFDCLAQ